jgi:hypothetical protein
LCYCITLSHYKSTTTRRKSDFLPIKTKNYFFYKLDKAWIRDPDPGSGIRIRIEILGWIRIRIRIKRMRIRNTAGRRQYLSHTGTIGDLRGISFCKEPDADGHRHLAPDQEEDHLR